MEAANKLIDAGKAYRVSLRHKLSKSYDHEYLKGAPIDRRWIDGFMAAGYHSGLISLAELKVECLSAYSSIFRARMSKSQEQQLENRLAKLCVQDRVKI